MKKTFPILILILIITIITQLTFAQTTNQTNNTNQINIIMFHKQGCSACNQMNDFLEQLGSTYKNKLNIQKYEYNQEGAKELATNISSRYNMKLTKVPTLFINDKYFVGYNQEITTQLTQEIQYCSTNQCISPFEKQPNTSTSKNTTNTTLKIITAILLVIISSIIIRKKKN